MRLAPEGLKLHIATLFAFGVFGSGVALAIGNPIGEGMGLSGSVQYVPATVMIAGVIWFLWKASHPTLPRLGVGVGLFALALALRSLDQRFCDTFPGGTHFMWHVTNCLVFWYLIKAYAVENSKPSQSERTVPARCQC